MAFDENWEDSIYKKGKQVNRIPYDFVVSIVHRLFSNIEDMSDVNALELGCGTGNNLGFLLDFGFDNVHGIDGSKTALSVAEKNVVTSGSGQLKLIDADFSTLPFEDDSYSFVLDRGSITHNDFAASKCIFKEAYRVLRPGGYMVSALFSNAHSSLHKAQYISRSFYNAFKDETGTDGLKTSFFSLPDVLELCGNFDIKSCVHEVKTEMVGDPKNIAMWYVIAQKTK